MNNVVFRTGSSATDCEWDQFLQQSPQGHFEQCSGWAAAKSSEGWQSSRIEILQDGMLIGGYQILYRRKGPFRIGYISKGPIIDTESFDAQQLAIDHIKSQSARHHIDALLVQPPENQQKLSLKMLRAGFQPNRLHRMIEATLLLDLSNDPSEIMAKVSRKTRQKVRQSIKRGVTIREGNESELPAFYGLMLNACRRQGNVRPNPANLNDLKSVWEYLRSSAQLRLSFAEIQDVPVAGLLSISFGNRHTLWKKGWNEACGLSHPNELLHWESLEWAGKRGYKICDFGSLDRGIAESLIEGKELSAYQKKTRHFFNIGFGGAPALLPRAAVWFGNPIYRKAYALFLKKRLKVP
jgi:peptidoglycan pentaglycine glycine transferase (the first glycine)